jgi:hypothetical protein
MRGPGRGVSRFLSSTAAPKKSAPAWGVIPAYATQLPYGRLKHLNYASTSGILDAPHWTLPSSRRSVRALAEEHGTPRDLYIVDLMCRTLLTGSANGVLEAEDGGEEEPTGGRSRDRAARAAPTTAGSNAELHGRGTSPAIRAFLSASKAVFTASLGSGLPGVHRGLSSDGMDAALFHPALLATWKGVGRAPACLEVQPLRARIVDAWSVWDGCGIGAGEGEAGGHEAGAAWEDEEVLAMEAGKSIALRRPDDELSAVLRYVATYFHYYQLRPPRRVVSQLTVAFECQERRREVDGGEGASAPAPGEWKNTVHTLTFEGSISFPKGGAGGLRGAIGSLARFLSPLTLVTPTRGAGWRVVDVDGHSARHRGEGAHTFFPWIEEARRLADAQGQTVESNRAGRVKSLVAGVEDMPENARLEAAAIASLRAELARSQGGRGALLAVPTPEGEAEAADHMMVAQEEAATRANRRRPFPAVYAVGDAVMLYTPAVWVVKDTVTYRRDTPPWTAGHVVTDASAAPHFYSVARRELDGTRGDPISVPVARLALDITAPEEGEEEEGKGGAAGPQANVTRLRPQWGVQSTPSGGQWWHRWNIGGSNPRALATHLAALGGLQGGGTIPCIVDSLLALQAGGLLQSAAVITKAQALADKGRFTPPWVSRMAEAAAAEKLLAAQDDATRLEWLTEGPPLSTPAPAVLSPLSGSWTETPWRVRDGASWQQAVAALDDAATLRELALASFHEKLPLLVRVLAKARGRIAAYGGVTAVTLMDAKTRAFLASAGALEATVGLAIHLQRYLPKVEEGGMEGAKALRLGLDALRTVARSASTQLQVSIVRAEWTELQNVYEGGEKREKEEDSGGEEGFWEADREGRAATAACPEGSWERADAALGHATTLVDLARTSSGEMLASGGRLASPPVLRAASSAYVRAVLIAAKEVVAALTAEGRLRERRGKDGSVILPPLPPAQRRQGGPLRPPSL